MGAISFDQLLNFLLGISAWSVVKLLVLLALLLYLIFAIVIIRQVDLMRKALNGILDLPLRIIAWIHLGIALGIFLLAIIIL